MRVAERRSGPDWCLRHTPTARPIGRGSGPSFVLVAGSWQHGRSCLRQQAKAPAQGVDSASHSPLEGAKSMPMCGPPGGQSIQQRMVDFAMTFGMAAANKHHLISLPRSRHTLLCCARARLTRCRSSMQVLQLCMCASSRRASPPLTDFGRSDPSGHVYCLCFRHHSAATFPRGLCSYEVGEAKARAVLA